MSITITTDVFCDAYFVWGEDCSAWAGTETGSRPRVREARMNVRSKGWTRQEANGYKVDLCPDCTKRFKQDA